VLFLFHQPFLQVKTESLALKGFMRVDSVSLLSTRQRQSDLRDQIHREFVNRPFQFNKRSQSFIGADNERFPSSRCASAIQIVRPSESTAETQPQLQPDLLSLSAMISQDLIASLPSSSPDESPRPRNLSACFSGLNDRAGACPIS
jgi:hypothetical protein